MARLGAMMYLIAYAQPGRPAMCIDKLWCAFISYAQLGSQPCPLDNKIGYVSRHSLRLDLSLLSGAIFNRFRDWQMAGGCRYPENRPTPADAAMALVDW